MGEKRDWSELQHGDTLYNGAAMKPRIQDADTINAIDAESAK